MDEVEDALGLSLETYLEDTVQTVETSPSPAHLSINQTLLDKLMHLTPGQLKDISVESLKLLSKLHTPPNVLLKRWQTLSYKWIGFKVKSRNYLKPGSKQLIYWKTSQLLTSVSMCLPERLGS